MEMSAAVNELAAALAKAQLRIEGAAKSATNPHFRNRFAPLSAVREAARIPLAENGLAISQGLSAEGERVTVTTLLLHSSGQWLRDSLTLLAVNGTPQAVGSACTYGRRYSFAALVGVTPDDEDDDGEAAEGRGNGKAQALAPQQPLVAPKGYSAWLEALQAAAMQGTPALEAKWKDPEAKAYRQHLTSTEPTRWQKLKDVAARASTELGLVPQRL